MKAKFDAVQEICDRGRDQILQEELQVNVVNLEKTDKDHISEVINKYTYYKPSKNSSLFSLSNFSFSKPAAKEEKSNDQSSTATVKPSSAWGSNTSPLVSVATSEEPEPTIGEPVVYEPVLIKPVVTKEVVDGQLVNAALMEGWSPDMTRIIEASEEVRKFLAS
jgi:hypothetical protein